MDGNWDDPPAMIELAEPPHADAAGTDDGLRDEHLISLELDAQDLDLLALWIEDDNEDSGDGSEGGVSSSSGDGALACRTIDVSANTERKEYGERARAAVTTDHNPTRRRERAEAAYLRERVLELEQMVQQLRKQRRTSSRVASDSGNPSAVAGSEHEWLAPSQLSEWQAIAQRQKKARSRAELDNHKLRQTLESQLKLARTLERLLRKRHSTPDINERKRRRLPLHNGPSRDGAGDADSVVFEALLASIERSHTQTKHVLDENGLFAAPLGHRCIEIKKAVDAEFGASGLYVEMIDVARLPFELDATGRAAWRCITSGYMQLDHEVYRDLAGDDDILAIKYAITMTRRRLQVDFNARAVMRRFQGAEQIVDVWESVSDTAGTHVPHIGAAGIRVRERGWTVFQRQGDATIVLTCMQMIPLISFHNADESRQVGLLTNLALDYYGEQIDQAQHGMESLLLDESRDTAVLETLVPGVDADASDSNVNNMSDCHKKPTVMFGSTHL